MLTLTDLQKIGLALMSVGIAFIFLGMLLLFDGGLLALGNLIFILGLGLFIGAERVTRFFFQWHKVKGTSFFFGGMLVVIFGFPLIGMLIELYGSFLLFSGFLPVVFNFLYRVPVIGWLLTLPGINREYEITDKLASPEGLNNIYWQSSGSERCFRPDGGDQLSPRQRSAHRSAYVVDASTTMSYPEGGPTSHL